jgi:hypothetical protein
MTTRVVTKNNTTITIINQEILFSLLENNEITQLELYSRHDGNYYKQLFELLKINSSIHTLCIFFMVFDNFSDDNEFYKLLCEFLTTTLYLKYTFLKDGCISIENSILVADAVKNNNSLVTVKLHYNNLNDNTYKYIIDSLKFNKTVASFVISNWSNPLDINDVAELLKVNTALNEIILCIRKITNYDMIKKAVKNNRYITTFRSPHGNDADPDMKKIKTYFERNNYNLKLKSMLIQDL